VNENMREKKFQNDEKRKKKGEKLNENLKGN